MPNWYYAIDDDQFGPVAEEDIQRMIASGELHGNDLLWQAGMTDWVEVQEVFPSAAAAAGPAAPLQPEGVDVTQPSPPETFKPVTERQVRRMPDATPVGGTQVRVHPLAILSVVLAVASLFVCVSAIPAVIVGHMALAQINREPERYEGKSVAIVGLVLGYLFLLPLALLFILMFLALLAG